jgi:acetyltransferase-like isoleucine patch superfamily enzyme
MGIPIIKMVTIGLLPSPLKKIYYKLKGARIGKNVKIGMLTVINCKDIDIGDYTEIAPLCFFNVKKLKFGKRVKIHMQVAIDNCSVEIDNDSVIMEQVVIGGMETPRSSLKIGKRVKIFPFSFINPTEPVTIEDDVGIGGANYIFTHGSWQSVLDGYPVGFGPVTIKKGVWFPWRVFVMPNVTVGEYATIGAGSIITKNVPERTLTAGTPAKVIRTEDQYIRKYSFEERAKIIVDILTEFVEYMKFLEYKTELLHTNNSIVINISKNKKIYRINYYSKIDIINDPDIIISLSKIDSELLMKLKSSKKIWFDITDKRTFFTTDRMWKRVLNFFSRYGIRFEIES